MSVLWLSLLALAVVETGQGQGVLVYIVLTGTCTVIASYPGHTPHNMREGPGYEASAVSDRVRREKLHDMYSSVHVLMCS